MGLLDGLKNDKDVVLTDFGASDRERWEAENAAAAAKGANWKKKGKKFRHQRKPTKEQKSESKSRAPGVTVMIEKLKKAGLAGLKNRPPL